MVGIFETRHRRNNQKKKKKKKRGKTERREETRTGRQRLRTLDRLGSIDYRLDSSRSGPGTSALSQLISVANLIRLLVGVAGSGSAERKDTFFEDLYCLDLLPRTTAYTVQLAVGPFWTI